MKMIDLLSEEQQIEKLNRNSNVLYEIKTIIRNGSPVKIYSWKPKSKSLVDTDYDRAFDQDDE